MKHKTIKDINPDLIINAAAKVGGILANNTFRTEFILENLKININILEALINFPETKLINLGSSCIYPLNASIPTSKKVLMENWNLLIHLMQWQKLPQLKWAMHSSLNTDTKLLILCQQICTDQMIILI